MGGYLERLKSHFNLIERHVPIFSKPKTKNVRYILNDNFLILWFRFFYKYQNYIESGALNQLHRIIMRDISVVEGFMLERYFRQKLRESQRYTQIGQFWDRKGENEIDIVAINEIDGIADLYEVKKDKARYDENLLKQKVAYMLQVCPELKKLDIHLACLSLEDM